MESGWFENNTFESPVHSNLSFPIDIRHQNKTQTKFVMRCRLREFEDYLVLVDHTKKKKKNSLQPTVQFKVEVEG